jgi:hypothetical protein
MMTTQQFPEFLTSLLATLEREARRYVVYRDDDSEGRRVVIRVDLPGDYTKFETALTSAGFVAMQGAHDTGVDFVKREAGTHGDSLYLVQIKAYSSTGKSGMANLLWRAATEESAAAARAHVRHNDGPS